MFDLFWLFLQNESAQYVCELCQKYGKAAQSAQSVDSGSSEVNLKCNLGTASECPLNRNTSHFQIPCSPGKITSSVFLNDLTRFNYME